MLRTLLPHAKWLLRTALLRNLSLPRSSITLRQLELLPKPLKTILSKSLNKLARKRGVINMTWEVVEKQRLKASVITIKKSSVGSERSLLKRLTGKMTGKFNNERVRLLHGQYLPQNWHHSIRQASRTTLQ